MKTVSDYHKHAAECRALARRMDLAEQRDQLLRMADTWDALASQRERALRLEETALGKPQGEAGLPAASKPPPHDLEGSG